MSEICSLTASLQPVHDYAEVSSPWHYSAVVAPAFQQLSIRSSADTELRSDHIHYHHLQPGCNGNQYFIKGSLTSNLILIPSQFAELISRDDLNL